MIWHEGFNYIMDLKAFPKNIVQLIASYREMKGKLETISSFLRPETGMSQGTKQLYSIYTADIAEPNYPLDCTIMALYAGGTGIAYRYTQQAWVLKRLRTQVDNLAV